VARPKLERKKIRKVQNGLGITYVEYGSVALEGTVVDLHIGTSFSINYSALVVACGRPGRREFSGNFCERKS
jgi:hypothetical protein